MLILFSITRFLRFSHVDHVKAFIEFVTILFLFLYFVFSATMHMESYLPSLGTKAALPAREGEI